MEQIRAIIGLGHTLRAEVVAEDIGYPMSSEEFEAWLLRHHAEAA